MQIIEVKTMRQKIQFLNGKGRILELEKDFIKRQRTKAKRERKEYFLNQLLCLLMTWIDLKKKK